MTTFTSSDRENAENLVEEAPYHPGYEDAVVYPTVIVDSGASVNDREDSMQMLREQIHAQQCEINALRKALLYANNPKPLNEEEIPYVGILQNADTVPLGSEIWKTDEEFIKYKKIILATVRAMEQKVRGEK